jgi:hypothetical protein
MNDWLLIFIELRDHKCDIQISISAIAKREVISGSQYSNTVLEIVSPLSVPSKEIKTGDELVFHT